MCVEEDPWQELVDFETTGLEADLVTEVLREAYRLQVYVCSEDVSSKNVG